LDSWFCGLAWVAGRIAEGDDGFYIGVIFGIAWFKSWRLLDWVGFIFTFVIASLWGNRYYTPHHVDSTEPFLILFSLFYVPS